ncbi:MAG: hypothetical protein ACK58N_06525 [Synechocystis sp.]
MSFETQNSSNLNSDDAQQICPQLLAEIANDEELKTLTEEEINAVFGGRIKPILVNAKPTYGLSIPRFFK